MECHASPCPAVVHSPACTSNAASQNVLYSCSSILQQGFFCWQLQSGPAGSVRARVHPSGAAGSSRPQQRPTCPQTQTQRAGGRGSGWPPPAPGCGSEHTSGCGRQGAGGRGQGAAAMTQAASRHRACKNDALWCLLPNANLGFEMNMPRIMTAFKSMPVRDSGANQWAGHCACISRCLPAQNTQQRSAPRLTRHKAQPALQPRGRHGRGAKLHRHRPAAVAGGQLKGPGVVAVACAAGAARRALRRCWRPCCMHKPQSGPHLQATRGCRRLHPALGTGRESGCARKGSRPSRRSAGCRGGRLHPVHRAGGQNAA